VKSHACRSWLTRASATAPCKSQARRAVPLHSLHAARSRLETQPRSGPGPHRRPTPPSASPALPASARGTRPAQESSMSTGAVRRTPWGSRQQRAAANAMRSHSRWRPPLEPCIDAHARTAAVVARQCRRRAQDLLRSRLALTRGLARRSLRALRIYGELVGQLAFGLSTGPLVRI